MLKEKIDNLYLAKCRHCIMDTIYSYEEEGKLIEPRPDYVDYYAILKKKADGSFVNMVNKYSTFINASECKNLKEHYSNDIIFSVVPLSDYIISFDSLSKRDCIIVLNVLRKMNGFHNTYGYKYHHNKDDEYIKILKRTNEKY